MGVCCGSNGANVTNVYAEKERQRRNEKCLEIVF